MKQWRLPELYQSCSPNVNSTSMLNDYAKTCIMFQAAVFKWVISVLCVQCHNCCFVWSGWAELDEEWRGVLISFWPLILALQTRVSILLLSCYVTLKNTSSAILLNLDQNLDFIYFMVFSHMQVFSLYKYSIQGKNRVLCFLSPVPSPDISSFPITLIALTQTSL